LLSDAELYYYSFTDAIIADQYLHLPAEDRARIDPMITGFNPTSAHVGDFITITGSNFGAGTKVAFFKSSAPFSVDATEVNVLTANTMSVRVPAGASSGPIRVSNAAGSSTRGGFTVLP